MRHIGFASLCAVITVLLSVAPDAGAPAQRAGAAPSVKGTWVVIEAERELAPYPEIVGAKVAFGDTAFRIERTEGRAPWYGRLTVDDARKRIDMLHLYKGFALPTYGTMFEGLFKFEGDTLVIVHAEGHDARPTEFLTGYDLTLMKLRRTDPTVPSMDSLVPADARNNPDAKAAANYAPTPQRLLYTASRSLGMLRGAQENDLLLTVVYYGTGTMSDVTAGASPSQPVPLIKYQAEIDYRPQAMRLDVTRKPPQGAENRQISLVIGKAAWDEGAVTLDGPAMTDVHTPVPALADYRRVQVNLTPFGAVKAARSVGAQVMVTALPHGEYQLTYPFQGTTWKLLLDANRRPSRVETTVNLPAPNTPIVATYSGYKEFVLGDVQFPSHIAQTLGGKPVLDLQVTRCRCNNAYVIFPVPENLAKDAAAR